MSNGVEALRDQGCDVGFWVSDFSVLLLRWEVRGRGEKGELYGKMHSRLDSSLCGKFLLSFWEKLGDWKKTKYRGRGILPRFDVLFESLHCSLQGEYQASIGNAKSGSISVVRFRGCFCMFETFYTKGFLLLKYTRSKHQPTYPKCASLKPLEMS